MIYTFISNYSFKLSWTNHWLRRLDRLEEGGKCHTSSCGYWLLLSSGVMCFDHSRAETRSAFVSQCQLQSSSAYGVPINWASGYCPASSSISKTYTKVRWPAELVSNVIAHIVVSYAGLGCMSRHLRVARLFVRIRILSRGCPQITYPSKNVDDRDAKPTGEVCVFRDSETRSQVGCLLSGLTDTYKRTLSNDFEGLRARVRNKAVRAPRCIQLEHMIFLQTLSPRSLRAIQNCLSPALSLFKHNSLRSRFCRRSRQNKTLKMKHHNMKQVSRLSTYIN